MQQQSIRRGEQFLGCIQVITQNRVADRSQVQAKLMAAAGDRMQFKPRAIRGTFDNAPARDRPPAVFMIDDLSGRVIHVLAHGQVDFALVLGDDAADHSDVSLLDLTIVKLPAEFPMRFFIKGHHDHAGGVAIKPMNDSSRRMFHLHASDKAIGLFRPDAGHRQQAGWFIQHDQTLIMMKNRRTGGGRHAGKDKARPLAVRCLRWTHETQPWRTIVGHGPVAARFP